MENKYALMTPEELANVIQDDNISEEEKDKIADEIIKSIGVKVAALTILTTTRHLSMTKSIKAVIEEDGELYKFELRKISDLTPEKGIRNTDKDISGTLTVTIEEFI